MANKRRIFASPVLLGGAIFGIISMFCCFVFIVLYSYYTNQLRTEILILSAVLCIGIPVIAFVFSARRFFSIITIDEEGISRAFLGRFFKLTMKWDEIAEISYFESGMAFLMFSQARSIQGLSYWKITKIKNLIQIQLTQKNYDFVKQYIQQPIIGLTEAKIAQLKLKK